MHTHWGSSLAKQLVQLSVNSPLAADNAILIDVIESLALATDAGHTCLPLAEVDTTFNNTWQSHSLCMTHQQALHPSPNQLAPIVVSDNTVSFCKYYLAEHNVALHLKRLMHTPNTSLGAPISHIDNTLNTLQQQAVQLALTKHLCLITGGPGTGKTYTLVRIIDALCQQATRPLHVAMAAPTGKAAGRMQEVLDSAFNDADASANANPNRIIHSATTVHRLIGLSSGQSPSFNPLRTLPYDVIVIDEASMLDLFLANHLLSAIRTGTRLILLGDANQLAAVDVGAILADICTSPLLQPYHVQLTESRRFTSDSSIGYWANMVLHQHTEQIDTACQLSNVQYVDVNNSDKAAYLNHLHQLTSPYRAYCQALQNNSDFGTLFATLQHYRILCATRYGPLGTHAVNRACQQYILSQLSNNQTLTNHSQTTAWYNGKLVMLTVNLPKLGLANGDIAICVDSDYIARLASDAPPHTKNNNPQNWWLVFAHKAPLLCSMISQDNLEPAFAMTIHKSQGSEFDQVAIVIPDISPPTEYDNLANPEQPASLYSKQLLYTAITRSKVRLDVYATHNSLQQTMLCDYPRHTNLKLALQ